MTLTLSVRWTWRDPGDPRMRPCRRQRIAEAVSGPYVFVKHLEQHSLNERSGLFLNEGTHRGSPRSTTSLNPLRVGPLKQVREVGQGTPVFIRHPEILCCKGYLGDPQNPTNYGRQFRRPEKPLRNFYGHKSKEFIFLFYFILGGVVEHWFTHVT